ADQAQRARGVDVGEGQAGQADGDGGGGGEDRRAGAGHRDPHGLVPVLVAVQLLAVAGDEQQRVVGADAEDQHHQHAGALRVDRQAGVLGEQVGGGLGEDGGEADRQQGQQPQERAAVGDQQQHGHHRGGGQQQCGV